MNYIYAFTLLRVALGLNIGLHGLVRIKNGPALFVRAVTDEFKNSGIPAWLLTWFANALPYAELFIGMALTVGLATNAVLVAGCILMLILLLGKSLVADWQVVTFQMIYILIYCILLAGMHYNSFSADAFIGSNP
ncbi:DoxX family membrane protein [Mucilaginibacter ginsenosidivorans]|uniref:DoxX family membrane protein n=1 Tax=Mucilaginibacter ginsenosidivorans TaxID=398053 RepID=A0A5B8UV89_9SPHI|nr:DoxX family membrane protein [Mucilaginibacter ginsenosidivorans]QEC62842.1 DoxX family membrane protein [Mucilaginibacter ginsenosidivorans]